MLITPAKNRRWGLATLLGIITGLISGMVKSGSEGFMPPRTPGRVAPPMQMLENFGMSKTEMQQMFYTYSEHIVHYAGMGVHYLMSIGTAMVYCWLAEITPVVKLWMGMAFGIVVALFFHGFILPLMGLSPWISALPTDEIYSEIVGTLLWAVTIEVFRRDLRNRWTKLPDPECKQ